MGAYTQGVDLLPRHGVLALESDLKINLAILFPDINSSKDLAQRIELLL